MGICFSLLVFNTWLNLFSVGKLLSQPEGFTYIIDFVCLNEIMWNSALMHDSPGLGLTVLFALCCFWEPTFVFFYKQNHIVVLCTVLLCLHSSLFYHIAMPDMDEFMQESDGQQIVREYQTRSKWFVNKLYMMELITQHCTNLFLSATMALTGMLIAIWCAMSRLWSHHARLITVKPHFRLPMTTMISQIKLWRWQINTTSTHMCGSLGSLRLFLQYSDMCSLESLAPLRVSGIISTQSTQGWTIQIRAQKASLNKCITIEIHGDCVLCTIKASFETVSWFGLLAIGSTLDYIFFISGYFNKTAIDIRDKSKFGGNTNTWFWNHIIWSLRALREGRWPANRWDQ